VAPKNAASRPPPPMSGSVHVFTRLEMRPEALRRPAIVSWSLVEWGASCGARTMPKVHHAFGTTCTFEKRILEPCLRSAKHSSLSWQHATRVAESPTWADRCRLKHHYGEGCHLHALRAGGRSGRARATTGVPTRAIVLRVGGKGAVLLAVVGAVLVGSARRDLTATAFVLAVLGHDVYLLWQWCL
jgi:hypothetical protein